MLTRPCCAKVHNVVDCVTPGSRRTRNSQLTFKPRLIVFGIWRKAVTLRQDCTTWLGHIYRFNFMGVQSSRPDIFHRFCWPHWLPTCWISPNTN
jgi:hypothetical protein